MESHKKTALLVIDVQVGLFEKSHPVHQAGMLLDNILGLVDKAHAAGAPVFYIQHCDQRDLLQGSPTWELHPRLSPRVSDHILFKVKSNSFEGTNLDEILRSLGVQHLVIAGLVTHGCVKNGCLGGKEHGYQVTLAKDAHSNFNPRAADVIDEWNTKLSEEGVLVKPSADITF